MNLLNVYIVLGYYETAEKNTKKGQSRKQKLTNQEFNNKFIKSQIEEIFNYRQSALHWNRTLFETKFTDIFTTALDCYDKIEKTTGVKIHSRQSMDNYLKQIKAEFQEFKNISLQQSQNASQREAITQHELEYLVNEKKATFTIKNYLGGTYYLTPDEIFEENGIYVIQESKNSSRQCLPSLADIQDGLFKLILFSNLDNLSLNNQNLDFTSRLKLTGKNVKNSLFLPCNENELEDFIQINTQIFRKSHKDIIYKLNLEANSNNNLTIKITNNNE